MPNSSSWVGKPGPVLLDTHYWVWLQNGVPGSIKPSVLRVLQDAADRGELRLSAISVWEVAMLEAKGRLRFNVPCEKWVAEALRTPGLSLVELTPEIAIDSTRLPGVFHGDPADRIIVATARCLQARLLTLDRGITAWCRQVGDVKLI